LSRHDAGEAGLSPPEREPADIIAAVDAAVDLEAADDGPGVDGAEDASANAAQDADVAMDSRSESGDAVVEATLAAEVHDAPAEVNKPFDVRDVPGLVYWLDAGKGVSSDQGSVTAWVDQSGQGHRLVNGGLRPTIVANAINGRPAIHISGTRDLLKPENELDVFGTGEMLVEMVALYSIPKPNPGSSYSVFRTTGAPHVELGFDLADSHAFLSVVGDVRRTLRSMAPVSAGAHLLGFHRTGADLSSKVEMRLDGALFDSEIDPAWGQDFGADLTLTSLGDIAEIVVVDSVIGESDLAAIEVYLKDKYGL
jgi:hypothetical protein